jgi:hypothetical protein
MQADSHPSIIYGIRRWQYAVCNKISANNKTCDQNENGEFNAVARAYAPTIYLLASQYFPIFYFKFALACITD